MDWKSYYRRELDQPTARRDVVTWLRPDAQTRDVVAARGVLSFPHTALRYAGPLQARTAHALLDTPGIERVLALGVLHGSSLEPYRRALDPAAPAARRGEGFLVVRGAFLPRPSEVQTPFGATSHWSPDRTDVARVDEPLLANEFSLDTFFAVLRLAADVLGRRPLPVCPLFVGMTRDPVTGSFAAAQELGEWLKAAVDAQTAVVATGDLVHYGTGYGAAWVDDEASQRGLERALEPWIDRVLQAAFVERDWELAYALSREKLGNDQREMLAVLSSYLGPAAPKLLAFGLSDYSEILGVAPPCVVASALAAYERRA